MRAPGNAGDKRVKRKRGSGSAAAVAARIERGYLKRIRTAGSTACVNNHVDSRGTGPDGSGHSAAERTSTSARDGGDDTHTRKRKTLTARAEHDRHARDASGDSRVHANTTVHRQSTDANADRSESGGQRRRQGTSRANTRPRMQRTSRPRMQRATVRESASTAKRQAT